jgi:membrane dipeptidase
VPEGLEDVSFYPNLFALLAEDPAWTEENLRKLAGENLIRVFSDVEKVKLNFLKLRKFNKSQISS